MTPVTVHYQHTNHMKLVQYWDIYKINTYVNSYNKPNKMHLIIFDRASSIR